ncbi:hypothetical protein ACFY8K_00430 [Streptomyces misionensis]
MPREDSETGAQRAQREPVPEPEPRRDAEQMQRQLPADVPDHVRGGR